MDGMAWFGPVIWCMVLHSMAGIVGYGPGDQGTKE